MRHRVWILGAPDPEMELIESILRARGERVEYATVWRDGVRRRVTPAEAYAPDVEIGEGLRGLRATAYMVECAPAVLVGSSVDGIDWAGVAVAIDHHRPGDPGYGRPPAEFLPASSIGQVIAELARLDALPEDWRHVGIHPDDPTYWDRAGELVPLPGGRTARHWHALGVQYDYRIPMDYVLAAAADHCLAAAYRGECPGVDPDALMRWRAASRAAFQRRAVEDVLADVERARAALREAPAVSLAEGIHARDLRGPAIPELPEAAAREGECFLASLRERDGRIKVVCQSGTPEQIRAFMEVWAPAQGLVDIYGDPTRGFAGGYLAA